MKKIFTFFAFIIGTSISVGQIITTVAGTGAGGFSGDGGPATFAKFDAVCGIYTDAQGNIYISDGLNNRIRKVNKSTGIITTVAGNGTQGFSGDGGPAINAAINVPNGVTVDASGNIYIADYNNHRIRKVDVNGIITTIAGTGTLGFSGDGGLATLAQLYLPNQVKIDPNGDLIVCDYANEAVRKIDLNTGIITTIAGTGGSPGYSGDGGQATSAKLRRPHDVAWDSFGNMYIAEYQNHIIRKVSVGGVISTYAGTGAASFSGDGGLATSATFNAASGVAVDGNNNVYVADWNNHRVRVINASSGIISTLTGNGVAGHTGDGGPAINATVSGPYSVVFDVDNNLCIGEWQGDVVRKIIFNPALAEGHVFDDVNSDCIQQPGDLPLMNWMVQATPGPYFSTVDANGYYALPLSAGTYTITHVVNSLFHIWDTVCPAPAYTHTASLNAGDTASNLDFALHANMYCAILNVDVAGGNVRRCMNNNYYVQYSNVGNDTAFNAVINITVDSLMTIVSSSIPWNTQVGYTYSFNIGTIAPFQNGSFYFTAYLDCSAGMGSTRCVKAEIGPVSPCTYPVDSTWDHSSVKVEGSCADPLACFQITNTGSAVNGNMQGPSTYRIYENGVLVSTGTFQLTGGADTTICWPANGNTIQLQADQRPGHPGHSHPNDYVEECGAPTILGIVNMLPPDDANYEVEIECIQVTGSYDPNDKSVIPAGVGVNHDISAEDELEYKIRFQNTGTDTAFTVVIRDTLSGYLDPATVISGVSSHNYSFKVFGQGILEWTFNNILLPDSNVNEPASHGFVKFKVKQMPGNQPGALIENRVGIIFDFNAPVITNTTFNTVAMNQTLSILQGQHHNTGIKVYPNPSDGLIYFVADPKTDNWQINIMDAVGRTIQVQDIKYKNEAQVDLRGYAKGLYFFRVTGSNGTVNAGKIIVR